MTDDRLVSKPHCQCPLTPNLVCRDLIAQITNYIAPLHLNKMSTLPIMAQQFHHSSQTHNNHYSSSTIVTDPNSNNKINDVLVAWRFIWSALGDGSPQQRYGQMKYHIVTSQETIWTTLLRRHIVVHLQEQPNNKQVR